MEIYGYKKEGCNMKKFITYLLTAAMTVSLLPVTALAATVETEVRQTLAGEATTIGAFFVKDNKDTQLTLQLDGNFDFVEKDLYFGFDEPVTAKYDIAKDQVVVDTKDQKKFQICGLTVVPDSNATVGDVATITMDGVSVDVAKVVDKIDYSAEDALELDVREVQILAGGTASFTILGVDKTLEFANDEPVALKLNSGFTFVEGDFTDHNGDIIRVQTANWDGEDEIVVLSPKEPGNGFDLIGLTIKADAGLAVGTEAKMTVSMVGYDDMTKTIATVVSKITAEPDDEDKDEDKDEDRDEDVKEIVLSAEVNELVFGNGDTAEAGNLKISLSNGRKFSSDQEIIVRLGENFAFDFADENKIAVSGGELDGASGKKVVIQPNDGVTEVVLTIANGLAIKYTGDETPSAEKSMEISVSYGSRKEEVELPIAGAVKPLDFGGTKDAFFPDGKQADMRRIFVTLGDGETFDSSKEKMILTLDKNFVFGDTRNMTVDGGKLLEVDGDEMVFETESGREVLSIVGLPVVFKGKELPRNFEMYAEYENREGEVTIFTVTEDVLLLDVEKQNVKNGGKLSFDTFGVDKKYGSFVEGEKVTLTLSEGFQFVEGDIRDGDGTVLQEVEWGKNKVIVPAPAKPGYGFDMEGLTIHATSAQPGDVAEITASVDGCASVTKEVAVVVKKNSGSSSNKNNNKTESKPAEKTEAPKVTVTESAANETAETAAPDVAAVPQETKAELHTQLQQAVPAAEVVGEGAYTFAVTAAETSAETTGTASQGAKDPEKVSFDLSSEQLADTAHLTLVKYVEQPDGTVEIVKLGGAYDEATGTFSAYVDGEGTYDLIYDPDVTKITFGIGDAEVSLNDTEQPMDVAPVLQDGVAMVPLRAIAVVMGAEVSWDEVTKTVFMVMGDQVILLTIDGEDGRAMLLEDRTMVELRYIGKTFGAGVRWIPGTQSIEIVK